jgi:hypothetical protein
MGYLNPLLQLPAGQDLLQLPATDRIRIGKVMRALRHQANTEAEKSWAKRKGPMAAYWRAVSTYARHMAHVLEQKQENK